MNSQSSTYTNCGNNLLKGKKGIVMGVANDLSLAWHIAQQARLEGAEIMISYQDEMLLKRVEPLAKKIDAKLVQCNVNSDESLDSTFQHIKNQWGYIDFVVHAIAFSDKNELRGRYVDTSRPNFTNTMEISCYSLAAISRRAADLMHEGGSIVSLTYYGAEKIVTNYNVMGVAKAGLEASIMYIAEDLGKRNIRVNGISAGPVRTLASSGIGDFHKMLSHGEKISPMRRNITGEDVGHSAVFLLSDRAKNITGEILHVDSGMHAVGVVLRDE